MAAQLRPGDSLARFSDDGYAVLVENTTERAARALADRLLKTLGVRVKVRGHEVDLSASAGVALSQTGEDAQAVMDAWMNSPDHRRNILDCDYTTLGVGVHFGTGGPWWTQDFGF